MESDLFLKLAGLVLGAVAGLGGILVFIVKAVIGNRISRDLEKFKVRFSSLYEEQGRAIRDLYGAVAETEDDINNLLYKYKPIGLDPPRVDEVDVIRRMRNLQLLFSKSRIYLDDQTCASLRGVCGHLSSAVGLLEKRRMFLDYGPGDRADINDEVEMDAFEEIKTRTPEAKAVLEREFRRLLGTA